MILNSFLSALLVTPPNPNAAPESTFIVYFNSSFHSTLYSYPAKYPLFVLDVESISVTVYCVRGICVHVVSSAEYNLIFEVSISETGRSNATLNGA